MLEKLEKVPLNSFFNKALINSEIHGVCTYNNNVMTHGEMLYLKSMFEGLWVDITHLEKPDKNILIVQLLEPPSWVAYENRFIKNKLKHVLPSHFLCSIEYEDDGVFLRNKKIKTAIHENKIKKILKGGNFEDFTSDLLQIYCRKLEV